MRIAIGWALVLAVAVVAAPCASACGGHEARAADCLEQLFGEHGDDFTYSTTDHQVHLTNTETGATHSTVSGTEDAIVEDALNWLASQGITPSNDDCRGNGVQAIDIFENAELCG
jgi:hypothetical protein